MRAEELQKALAGRKAAKRKIEVWIKRRLSRQSSPKVPAVPCAFGGKVLRDAPLGGIYRALQCYFLFRDKNRILRRVDETLMLIVFSTAVSLQGGVQYLGTISFTILHGNPSPSLIGQWYLCNWKTG